jgi:hypothetical protein
MNTNKELLQAMIDAGGAWVSGYEGGVLYEGPAWEVIVRDDGFWFLEAEVEFGHQAHWVKGEMHWGPWLTVTNGGRTFMLYALTDGCDGDAEQARQYREWRKQYLASQPPRVLKWREEQKKLAESE